MSTSSSHSSTPGITTSDNNKNDTGSSAVTAVSWCTGRFDPPTLVVATSTGARLFRYSETARAWQILRHWPGSWLDVAWAPNVGRRYHTVALVSSQHEGSVTVCRWNRHNNNNNNTTTSSQSSSLTMLSQQEIASAGGCWRCQWNVTGTVLATSGDGGRVRLYKADHQGQFRCVAQIAPDPQQQQSSNKGSSGVAPGTS